MLPLDSPTWSTLRTFSGHPEELPKQLREWMEVWGEGFERDVYLEFVECFFCQAEIHDSAFAVVPYLVKAIESGRTKCELEYIIDIGLIEANRIAPLDDEEILIPAQLEADYLAAIAVARRQAIALLEQGRSGDDLRYLLSAVASLHGDGDAAWMLWQGATKCPTCGVYVPYVEAIREFKG